MTNDISKETGCRLAGVRNGDVVVMSAGGQREGDKWFHPTLLMRQSDFVRRGNENGRSAPRVHSMGAIPPTPQAVNFCGGGARDMIVGRSMSGPKFDGRRASEVTQGYSVGSIQYLTLIKYIGVIYHWFARLRAWLLINQRLINPKFVHEGLL